VAQLTQRTNQMNAKFAWRRTEAEIQALLASGEAECLTVDVKDRFGKLRVDRRGDLPLGGWRCWWPDTFCWLAGTGARREHRNGGAAR